jgi:hypothetical protein
MTVLEVDPDDPDRSETTQSHIGRQQNASNVHWNISDCNRAKIDHQDQMQARLIHIEDFNQDQIHDLCIQRTNLQQKTNLSLQSLPRTTSGQD